MLKIYALESLECESLGPESGNGIVQHHVLQHEHDHVALAGGPRHAPRAHLAADGLHAASMSEPKVPGKNQVALHLTTMCMWVCCAGAEGR